MLNVYHCTSLNQHTPWDKDYFQIKLRILTQETHKGRADQMPLLVLALFFQYILLKKKQHNKPHYLINCTIT